MSDEVGRKDAVGGCEGVFLPSPLLEAKPRDARDVLLDVVRRLSVFVEEAVTRATILCRVGADFDRSCVGEGVEPLLAPVPVEIGGGAVAKKSTRS